MPLIFSINALGMLFSRPRMMPIFIGGAPQEWWWWLTWPAPTTPVCAGPTDLRGVDGRAVTAERCALVGRGKISDTTAADRQRSAITGRLRSSHAGRTVHPGSGRG